MHSAPPSAALSFFRKPIILSQAMISGIARETGADSYGICLPAKQVPKQLITHLTLLIRTSIMHISAFYQLKSSAGDIKYYLLIIPREDVATSRPYISLYHILYQQGQLGWNQYVCILVQLVELLDTFSRLGYTHGAIHPSNIYICLTDMKLRLGPPMPFAAYIIDVERSIMINTTMHSYDVCIPPECFLIYKSTINFLQPSTDAWMVGASLLYTALGTLLVDSHFTKSYHDYRVELIMFLFHALGPPRRPGSLPLQREAEEKLISSFDGIIPYLDTSYSNNSAISLRLEQLKNSVARRVILGLMDYNFNSRLRPGLALELMRREINQSESRATSHNRHSTSMHNVQFSYLPEQRLSKRLKSHRSRSLSPHKHKASAEAIPVLDLVRPSSHLCVETLARQTNTPRSKSAHADEAIEKLRSSIDYQRIAAHMTKVKALKSSIIPSPIHSSKDIQNMLRNEYLDHDSIDSIVIPTKDSLRRDFKSASPRCTPSSQPSFNGCNKRYIKVLRKQISGDLLSTEKKLKLTNDSQASKQFSQAFHLSADDQKVDISSKTSQSEETPELDRGDGLFVDSMDAPLLESSKGLPVMCTSYPINSTVSSAAEPKQAKTRQSKIPVPREESAKEISLQSDNSYQESITSPDRISKNSPTDICTIVLHRLSTPYKAELNIDLAVELRPAGHSTKYSFIGSVSNVVITEPPDFGISVPTNTHIKMVSFNPALSHFAGVLSGRLVVSINSPLNTCKVISFKISVDFREFPRGQEWVLSTNGLASALIEILY